LSLCSVHDDVDTATSSIQTSAGKSNSCISEQSIFPLSCHLGIPYTFGNCTGVLPEGLVRELPDADSHPEPAAPVSSGAIEDDLAELQRQLDALNSS
jgi:hypothetical protein